MAVSCPYDFNWLCRSDTRDWLFWFVNRCTSAVCHVALSQLLLALSGDVESNPGPGSIQESSTQIDAADISAVMQTLTRLASGQKKILSDLANIRTRQFATDEKVKSLTERVDLLEQARSQSSNSSADSKAPSAEIAALKASTDDSENRLRRNNLLFFGFEDNPSETWKQAEETVVAF